MGNPHTARVSPRTASTEEERGPERPRRPGGAQVPADRWEPEGRLRSERDFPPVRLAPTPLNEGSLPSAPEKPPLRAPNSNLIIKKPCLQQGHWDSAGFPPPAGNFLPAALGTGNQTDSGSKFQPSLWPAVALGHGSSSVKLQWMIPTFPVKMKRDDKRGMHLIREQSLINTRRQALESIGFIGLIL